MTASPQDLAKTKLLLTLCEWIATQPRIVPAIHQAAADYNSRASLAGWSPISTKTMERKYYAWRKSPTETTLADHRRVATRRKSRASSPAFIAHLHLLATRHQRKMLSAIEELYTQWRTCQTIPGYEGVNTLPNTPYPKGWTTRNLLRKMPDKRTRTLHNQGIRAAASAGMLAQVTSTRVGLWPCSHVLFDDVWLDMLISGYSEDGRAVLGRPLQIGALDYYTGKRLCWGTKLRTKRKDGTHTGLNGDEMLLVLVQYLMTIGYSPRGTVLVVENGTASITKAQEDMILQLTGGLVKVDRSGLTGMKQAAGHTGRAVGNPRHKAALESWHNLFANRNDSFGLATGHDRIEPERLHGQRALATKELSALSTLPPERAQLISASVPTMSELADHLARAVSSIDGRTQHDLEGWEACGFTTDEYSLAGDGQWTNAAALDSATLALCHDLAQLHPTRYRRRKLSPTEAFIAATSLPENKLILLPATAAVALMGVNNKFKLRPNRGEFTIDSRRRHHTELRFETRVTDDHGRLYELPCGQDYYGILNPFSKQLIVLDQRDHVLGLAELVTAIPHNDEAARLAAFGRKSQRNADIIERASRAAAPDQRLREMRSSYNQSVIDGEPILLSERSDAHTLAARRQTTRPVPANLTITPCEGMELDDWTAPPVLNPPPPPVIADDWGLPTDSPHGSFYPPTQP